MEFYMINIENQKHLIPNFPKCLLKVFLTYLREKAVLESLF